MEVLLFDAGSTLATIGVLLVLFIVVVIVCVLLMVGFAAILPASVLEREAHEAAESAAEGPADTAQ